MKSIQFLLIMISVSCTTIAPIEQRKSWRKVKTPDEVSTLSHASCFADAMNFYIFSGIDENGEGPFNNIGYTYEIKSGSWKKWTNESGPEPIQNFASAKTDDHIYIFGGQDADHPNGTNKFYRYTLKGNTWEVLPVSHAIDERWRAAAIVSDRGFLVYGGKGIKQDLNAAYFDFESKHWDLIPTAGEVGTRVSGVFAYDSHTVTLLGGFIGTNPQESGFSLDLVSRQWSPLLNPILGPRVNPKFLISDSNLYVLGGATNFAAQTFGGKYNLREKIWSEIPKIDGFDDYKGYEITLLKDEGLLLSGGRLNKDNSYNDKLYFYKFKTNHWIELKSKYSPPGTVGGCLVSNPQREVFALGGIMNIKGSGLKHSEGLWILNASEND
ncbi:MAG: kelch repeat-containing protein [Bdellovibrionota bacterium]